MDKISETTIILGFLLAGWYLVQLGIYSYLIWKINRAVEDLKEFKEEGDKRHWLR